MINVSDSFAQAAAVAVIQVSVVMAIGLAAGWALRRRGPAWQSSILRATLLFSVALPLVGPFIGSVAQPKLEIPAPPVGPQFAVGREKPDVVITQLSEQPGAPVLETTGRRVPWVSPAETRNYTPPSPSRYHPPMIQEQVSVRDIAIGVWALGALVLLLRLAAGQLILIRVRLNSAPAPDRFEDLVREYSQAGGISAPGVRVSPIVRSPFLAGVLRPTIYLPVEIDQSLSETEQRTVVAHEVTHAIHRDCGWILLGNLLQAVFWINPLAWILGRQLQTVSEQLCDQVVVQGGVRPREYADFLLKLAEKMSSSRAERLAGVGVVSIRSTLGRRVVLILDGSRRTMTRLSLRSRAAVFATSTVAVGLVALSIAAGQGTKSKAEPSDEEALALYKQMEQAYDGLKSLSARIENRVGTVRAGAGPINFTFLKPGFAKLSVLDGANPAPVLTAYVRPDGYELTDPNAPGQYQTGKRMGPNSNDLSGMDGFKALSEKLSIDIGPLPELLSKAPRRGRQPILSSMRLGPDRVVNGIPCRTLVGEWTPGKHSPGKVTVAIGAKDHLIRSWSDSTSSTWTYQNVRVDARFSWESIAFVRQPWYTVAKPFSDSYIFSGTPEQVNRQRHEFEESPRDVQHVLHQFNDALRAARTLSFVVDGRAPGPYRGVRSPRRSDSITRLKAYVGPGGRMRFSIVSPSDPSCMAELVSDGVKVYEQEGVIANEYVARAYSPDNCQLTLGNSNCMGAIVMLNALAEHSPLQGLSLYPDPHRMTASTQILDGQTMDVLTECTRMNDEFGFPTKQENDTTVYFSRRDHLPRKILVSSVGNDGVRDPNPTDLEVFSDYQVNPVFAKSTFVFKPAPGTKPVTSFSALFQPPKSSP